MNVDAVLARAEEEWNLHIYDPQVGDHSVNGERCRARILRYYQEGLGWTWRKSYPGDGRGAWCGAFLSWCWAAGGVSLNPLRYHCLASTERLHEAMNDGLLLEVPPNEILPGDIAVVGPKNRYGDHITLAKGWNETGNRLKTINGNGHGVFPNGTHGEGVVKTDYPRTAVRFAYRAPA